MWLGCQFSRRHDPNPIYCEDIRNAEGISGTGGLLTIELKLRASAPVGASPLTLADVRLNDPNGRDYVTGLALRIS